MDTIYAQRNSQLLSIAEKDLVYQTWSNSYEDCREAFARFANSQSEEIRNMLYGYVDCGRMAQQRIVNLACEHMIFSKE